MNRFPVCSACRAEIGDGTPGALVFGPPSIGANGAEVGKWHLCRDCFGEHFVLFSDDAWAVEHSVLCRLSGFTMTKCPYHRAIARIAVEPDPQMVGRWKIVDVDSEGLPSLVRA